jgi:mannose-6-phosphate isomerase-like protein (cupin superfamily)
LLQTIAVEEGTTMPERDHGYDRGWYRYGFETQQFVDRAIHGGGTEIGVANLINRGYARPHISYGIVYPERRGDSASVGLHIHRDDPTMEDVEEWYIVIDGTGVQRFTNGDSVDVGPGDLIACYPGTGHSLEATGEAPLRFVSITPRMFTANWSVVDSWPETFEPRMHVLTTDESKNPLTAECSDCGATWTRPDGDRGGNTLADWSVDHACTRPFEPVHVGYNEPMPSTVEAS